MSGLLAQTSNQVFSCAFTDVIAGSAPSSARNVVMHLPGHGRLSACAYLRRAFCLAQGAMPCTVVPYM
eukprot:1795530-Pyramimonas_sp.AAC.1